MAAALVVLLVFLDQLSKAMVENWLGDGRVVSVIGDFFTLHLVQNAGAAWSLFAGQAWGRIVLSLISFLVSLFLCLLLSRLPAGRGRAVTVLILSGSLGNLIDRLRFGVVTDFLSFRFGSYLFPTFNLADALITVGAGLLLLFSLFDRDFLDALFLPFTKKERER